MTTTSHAERPALRRFGRVLRTLLVWGLLLIALPALVLEYSRLTPFAPYPFAFLFGVWGVALIVRGVRRKRRDGRGAFAFSLGVLCLALAGAEAYLGTVLRRPTRLAERPAKGTYIARDETMGFVPVPGSRSRFKSMTGDETVWNVVYSIGEDGLRIRPPLREPPPKGSALFFACSFMYGSGLSDDQTIPWQVEELLGGKLRCYNFAFPAYGPHQMLAGLESGRSQQRVEYPPRHAVYLAIADHARRVSGHGGYGRDEPKFVLQQDGSVARAGLYRDDTAHLWKTRLRQLIHHSHLGRALMRRIAPPKYDVPLLVAIVATSRDHIQARWPDCEFHVLLWDDMEPWCTKIEEGLRAEGIEVRRVTEIIPDLNEKKLDYQIHAVDPHPNPRATQALARFLAVAFEADD